MEAVRSNPFARGDTLLGVCQALGEDFGFNPLWLRIAFGASLMWNPAVVLGVYVSLGVVLAISHWVFPQGPRRSERRRAAAGVVAAPIAPVTIAPVEDRLAEAA